MAKYLSENKFPKKILATLLVSALYDDENMEESLADFVLSKKLGKFNKQAGRIFLYYSEDDLVVPHSHLGKYRKELPDAVVREFKKRGHFNQADFPELVNDIKGLYLK